MTPLRWVSVLVLGTAVALNGCGPKLAPLPPVNRPGVDAPPPPVMVPAVATRFTIPTVVVDTRYRVQSVAQLERDSAGKQNSQRITSQLQLVMRQRRTANGGLQASGRMTGYTITPSLTPTPVVVDSLRFDAVLDSFMLRVVSQPPLANECDRPETGALTLIRDLLVRVPSAMTVGDQWRDSTVHIVCRSNIPMTVRTASDYVVTGTTRGDDGMHVVIRRTSTTRLEGKSVAAWRSVEVTGIGTGTLDAEVSVLSGAVQRVTGSSVMTLTATDLGAPAAARVQRMTQRVTLTGEAITR